MNIVMAIVAIVIASIILAGCFWMLDRDKELKNLKDFEDAFNEGVKQGKGEEGHMDLEVFLMLFPLGLSLIAFGIVFSTFIGR